MIEWDAFIYTLHTILMLKSTFYWLQFKINDFPSVRNTNIFNAVRASFVHVKKQHYKNVYSDLFKWLHNKEQQTLCCCCYCCRRRRRHANGYDFTLENWLSFELKFA